MSLCTRICDPSSLLQRGDEMLEELSDSKNKRLLGLLKDCIDFVAAHKKCPGTPSKILSFLPPEIVYDFVMQQDWIPRPALTWLKGPFGTYARFKPIEEPKMMDIKCEDSIKKSNDFENYTDASDLRIEDLHQVTIGQIRIGGKGPGFLQPRHRGTRDVDFPSSAINALKVALQGYRSLVVRADLYKEDDVFIHSMETFFQAALASASPVADVRLMDIPKSIPSAEKFALQFLLSPSDCSQKHLVIHDCEFGDSFYQTAIDTFVKGRPFKLLRLYDCSVSTEEFTKIVDFLESCPQNECSINVDVTSIDDLQSLLTDRGYKKELGVSLLTDDKTETYTLIRSEKYEVFIDFLHGYIGVSFYYRKREIPCDQRKVEETQIADKIFTVCPEN